MGCAFNMYSPEWADRIYGLVIFFYCWIFPLLIIFFCYIGIMYETRSSGRMLFRIDKKKNNDENEEGKHLNNDNMKRSIISHSQQRVNIFIMFEILHTNYLDNNYIIYSS